MNYNTWFINNLIQLAKNYTSRYKYIQYSSFEEFCQYIYNGIKIGAYLPKQYIKNIKENK